MKRGEVSLTGKVQRRSDAELLVRLGRRVPGVVDVRSTLTWEWDDSHPGKERPARVPTTSAWNRH